MNDTLELDFAALELASRGIVDDFGAGLQAVAGLRLDDAVEGLSLPSGTRLRELSTDGALRFMRLLGRVRLFLCAGSRPKVVTQVAEISASYIVGKLSAGSSQSAQEAEAFAHFVLHLGVERVCHDFPALAEGPT